jgi:hypothetical protein
MARSLARSPATTACARHCGSPPAGLRPGRHARPELSGLLRRRPVRDPACRRLRLTTFGQSLDPARQESLEVRVMTARSADNLRTNDLEAVP